MIDGSSAENPMRMTKFAAHAKMSRSHTSTYEGMDDTRSGVYPARLLSKLHRLVQVELPHLRTELLHHLPIQLQGRRGVRRQQGEVLGLLGIVAIHQWLLDELRALELLHPQFAEIEERIAEQGDPVGVAVDRFKGVPLQLVG